MIPGLHIDISESQLLLNVALRVIMGIYFLTLVIPLLVKEAKVKNGLRILRIEMLFTTTIVFIIGADGLLIIVLRYLGVNIDHFVDWMTLFNSVLLLVYMMLKRRIYTQRYSPEQKQLHEKIERFERREQRKLDKKNAK